MSLPWSAAKPGPQWDLLIQPAGQAAVGVRLLPGQNGQLVGQQARRLDATSPTTYDYGALNPYRERPYVAGRLVGGMGEAVQTSATPTRYTLARNADLSIGGMRRIGPAFQDTPFPGLVAGALTGETDVRQFVIGPHNTATDNLALFALVKESVYVRDPASGGWALSRALGAGVRPYQAVDFRGDAGDRRLWVATLTGALWTYDGATWTQATLPVGADACRVAAVGRELYAAGLYDVRVCTTGDPMLAASWGGAIRVGDRASPITGLAAVGGVLVVFKETGAYTLAADGSDNELFPELRAQPSVLTGRTAVAWKDHLWFGAAEGFYRMDAAAALEPIGPERLLEHGAGVRGRVTCAGGHNDWFLYAGAYDAATGDSSLLKYGTWTNPGDGADYRFADAWHGALAAWTGKRITALAVVSFDTDQIGTRAGPALWVGFADGTAAWTPLPTVSPDPAADPACRFTAEESWVEHPDHHALAWADLKRWRAFAATGPRLDATRYVTVRYRLDDAVDWTELGTSLLTSGVTALPPSPAVGRLIRVREVLHGTSTSTPEVEALVLLEQVRPALELEYSATALCRNRCARRDGTLDWRTAAQVRAALQATAGPGPTTVWFPDGTSQDVDVVVYGEALPNPDARWGVEWTVPVTFVQWRTNAVYGIWERLAVRTWGEVAAYDWARAGRL